MRARTLTAAVLLLGLAAMPAGAASKRALRAFSSCPQLLSYARAHGKAAVGTGWVPTPFSAQSAPPSRVPKSSGDAKTPQPTTAEGAPQASGDAAGGAGTGADFSTTNVQEQGVDEPDIVKTNGNVIFAVVNGWLHAVDARGAEPKLLDTLELDPGYGHELLLHGDRLLVVQNAWLQDESSGGTTGSAGSGSSGGGTVTSPRQNSTVEASPPDQGVSSPPMPSYNPIRPVARLTEIDVSDPSNLRVLRNERDDGEFVDARMTGDTARIVLASRAPVMYAVMAAGAAQRSGAHASGQAAVIAKRLRQVRRAKLAAWQPHTFFRDHRRPKHARFHALMRCTDVRHTARFSGLDTVTILTVDMSKGLPSVDADAIMSDAQIVYGSPDRIYVATQRWLSPQVLERPEPPATTTQIHEFDTSNPDATSYVASGTVTGYLLNQFAMSEYQGVLRVASTDQPRWWGASSSTTDPPANAVTTLDTDTMGQVGRLGGLGAGERIYAVRFIGNTGYVVTFHQVDPLFTLDLSHPGSPTVAGELQVAGYSAYLHPLGKDLLLGVGQDAGDDGRATGTQISLFDVSDPAHPKRLAKYAVGSHASSTAEFDHHAFLYWPKTGLVVIPLQLYDYENSDPTPFVGAIGLHVDRDGIDEVGRVAHPSDDCSLWDVQRATVIGERVFTLSSAGMLASKLSDLSEAAPFLTFPDKPVYTSCGGPYAKGAPESAQSCPVYEYGT